jgi:hypothetical protein
LNEAHQRFLAMSYLRVAAALVVGSVVTIISGVAGGWCFKSVTGFPLLRQKPEGKQLVAW